MPSKCILIFYRKLLNTVTNGRKKSSRAKRSYLVERLPKNAFKGTSDRGPTHDLGISFQNRSCRIGFSKGFSSRPSLFNLSIVLDNILTSLDGCTNTVSIHQLNVVPTIKVQDIVAIHFKFSNFSQDYFLIYERSKKKDTFVALCEPSLFHRFLDDFIVQTFREENKREVEAALLSLIDILCMKNDSIEGY